MIDFFNVPMWEESKIETEQEIIAYLKYVFNQTEKIHKPYNTHLAALVPKEKFLEYTELLRRISQNCGPWLAKRANLQQEQTPDTKPQQTNTANTPTLQPGPELDTKPQQDEAANIPALHLEPELDTKTQQDEAANIPALQPEPELDTETQQQEVKASNTSGTQQKQNTDTETQQQDPTPAIGPAPQQSSLIQKLYDTVAANLYLRKGQCEEQLFLDSSGSYKKALELLREYRPLQDGHASGTLDSLLDLLIQLNLGKYLRNMSYFESRSRFNLAIHAFEKTIKMLETQETGKFSREQSQIWLESAVDIGKAKKNLYELSEAEGHFKIMVNGLWKLASKDKQDILKNLRFCQAKLPEQENAAYLRLQADKKVADIFLVRALVQLAVIYRKQRKYDKAKDVCKAVIRMEPENAEAINNLGVCHRKDENYGRAISLFKPLMRRGNRLATINYWKCVLRQEERERGSGDATKKEIQEFLKQEEQDREYRLLQARFLQFLRKHKKAYAIFQDLYEAYPYIYKGTIGLKAYYNMATCLMQAEKYQQAARILNEILVACPKDRLAQIDWGWCMMKMNRYQEARDEYLEVMDIGTQEEDTRKVTIEDLKNYRPTSHLSRYELVRQLNNLGECYLRMGNIPEAVTLFQKVLGNENSNIEAMNYLAQCYMLEGEKLEKARAYEGAESKYAEAIKQLETAAPLVESAEPERKEKNPLASNLFLANTARLQAIIKRNADNPERKKEGEIKYKENMEHSLLYYPDTEYSQKACCKFAEFLLESEASMLPSPDAGQMPSPEYSPRIASGIDTESINLYRAFSRIKLWKQEEGYEKFSHFMQSREFISTGAGKRGKILAWLFLIYQGVTALKEECRYSPSAGQNAFTPAHYTSLATLKILVAENDKESGKQPSLRLWNSVHMNDPNEGACFIELLKLGCKNSQKNPQGQNQEQEDYTLSQYFPHLNNNAENLAPINGNVYITSFCQQKDDLQMWMAYGDNAEGCSITFADDFFDIRSQIKGPLGLTEYSDKDYPLYQVQYLDEKELLENGRIKIVSCKKETSARCSHCGQDILREQAKTAKAKRIESCMGHIWEHISELLHWMDEKIGKEENGKESRITPTTKAAVTAFVADALNEIRFLFKYSDYADEEEMRLVRCSYQPQFEDKFPIPRMYIDVGREIQIGEVMLGAKISPQEANEIVSWLYATGKVRKVTKSQKHYK